MTFIHVADIHASKERKEQTIAALKKIHNYLMLSEVDFIVFAGDFWDSTITNTRSSGFSEIVSLVDDIRKLCDIFMVYGTPSHEPEGSLDIFKKFGIDVFSKIEFQSFSDYDILFIPEPRRSNFISQSQEETNTKINEYLDQIRQYHKNGTKPFVVVYHGEVKGAHYQNGIGVNSPIALSKELLQSTHADYYACGHIHEPQEVFKNCFYSGSAAPIDYGETHDAGFNVVTIDESGTKVERVSFGFPVNKTFDMSIGELPNLLTKSLQNTNLKVRLECDEKINAKDIEKQIVDSTKCVSCKVVPEYPAVTNIRAKEITEQKSIVDKVDTWAKVNNLNLSKSLLKKAQDLEDSMLIKYSFPKHTYRLLYVSVKGAIGLSVQEKNIDFTKYEPGVIVMVGRNGSGKTTMLENMHPFPCMLTLPGKLIDYFKDKDSHRILIYQDETGLQYRISIIMAANIKSGSTKYYVETGDGTNWKSVPECDGNLSSYNKYIEENFGSLMMFLRTSFFTDKSTAGYPDISTATKGERMELFSKLAGTDYYSTLNQCAKDASKDLDSRIKQASLLIGSKEGCERDVADYTKKLEETNGLISANDAAIEGIKESLKELRKQDIEYQKYLAKKESLRQLAEQYQKQIDDNLKVIEDIKADKILSDKLSENSDKIKLYKDLVEKNKGFNDQLTALNEQYSAVSKSLYPIQSLIDAKNRKMNEINISIANATKDIEILDAKSVSNYLDVCPTCGAKLSPEKAKIINAGIIKAKEDAAKKRTDVQQLKESKISIKEKIDSLSSDKDKYQNELDSLSSRYSDIEANIKLDNDTLEGMEEVKELLEAKPKFTDHDENISKLEVMNNSLAMKIQGQVAQDVCKDVTNDISEKESMLVHYEDSGKDLAAVKLNCESTIASNTKLLEQIDKSEKEIKSMQKDKDDYDLLSKSFSNSGIPALHLEAVIPGVMTVANNILHNSYGDNFTINFSAEHQGSTKVVEDFDITVFNAKKNMEEKLICVSSGELVWIKNAIYYAFSVTQHDNTGFGFVSRFMDESDTHLDSEMRVNFMKMINATHTAGNAYQTVLITHSQEIKDIAEQVIEL